MVEDGDEDAVRQAVTAFRAARDAGIHSDAAARRTRRRDDWRPAAERRRGRWPKAALAALVTSVTLGGVALAAGGLPSPFSEAPERRPEPSRGALVPPPPEKGAPPGSPSGSAASTAPGPETAGPTPRPSERTPPGAAQSHEALCRAYEKKTERGGKALDSTAWRRLIAAAGGENAVPSYCATLTDDSPASDKTTPDAVGDARDQRSPNPNGKDDPPRP
ncbi:hypothetical protein [Streptomyces sp. NPDC026092]|uniref:hypothetical protein n=1 Tax=Streptomyces sp. NPDC026092 TaxID=3154797 RepID=UPI0033E2E532